MKPLSQRAYARHRGCSLGAVQGAIASGRLEGALVYDDKGHAKIRDPEEADRIWSERTQPRTDQLVKQVARRSSPPPDPMRHPLVICYRLALYAVAHAALGMLGHHQAEKLAERARGVFGMPDVAESIDEEIDAVIYDHNNPEPEDDDE